MVHEKKFITQKIPPGRLIAVQQLYRSGQSVLTLTSYTTFEVNYGAWEIPADYPITSEKDPGKLFNKFTQPLQPN